MVCLPFFIGKNPSNVNLCRANPLLRRAGTKAVAPGRTSTGISFWRQARVSKKPGSETPGVPASEICATDFPLLRSLIIPLSFWCSLC